MYTIIRGADGLFHCQCRLQDCTERWTEDTLEKAVAAVKQFAKFMNGTKIKRKHITFLQPVPVVEEKLVAWTPFGGRHRA